jgi:hypothetical protein
MCQLRLQLPDEKAVFSKRENAQGYESLARKIPSLGASAAKDKKAGATGTNQQLPALPVRGKG